MWCEFLSDNLWSGLGALLVPPQQVVYLLQLGSLPEDRLPSPFNPPAGGKKTGLTRSFPSFPGVSHRLRHVCGQPQRGVPHARAVALAAPACGHQQRCGRCTPAGATRVVAGPAAGGVPVHQHCARPSLWHLCCAEDPAGHLDWALPGRAPAPGESADRRREEHAAPLGGKLP